VPVAQSFAQVNEKGFGVPNQSRAILLVTRDTDPTGSELLIV